MTNQIKSLTRKWPLLCGLLAFAFSFCASATDPLYENDSYLSYTIPPQIMPTIDATNFVNNNTFIVNFGAGTINPQTFETHNTLNYTNTGLMVANAGFSTNGSFVSTAPGCGFLFDDYNTHTGFHLPAANFFNSGDIHANSILDSGDNPTTNAICTINATNITNPGTFDVGANSIIKFTGQNVDLSHCSLTVDGLTQSSVTGTAGFNVLDEASGTDGLLDWHPSIDLTPTTASGSESIFFPPSSFTQAQQALGRMLPLTNATVYFQQPFASGGPNNIIVRAIYIQDSSPSTVTHDTYFGSTSLGNGAAHVVWHAPAYIDPVTGLTVTNYVVLSDLYISAINNPPLNGLLTGTPFTIVTTNTPNFPSVLAGLNSPGSAGFPPGFQFLPPNGEPVTNNGYAFVSVKFTPTTVATNSSSQNITNYLAVLPGRIQINADSNLDLTAANIANPVSSGLNYLSLRAPNQFNGNDGAHIFSPYSDINLGVTNGNLTITNLLEPGTPNWGGTLQAWTSDWLYTDWGGTTWDFRVLIINSSLNPTTPAQVQDLTFHATNNLVISDTFNVMRKLSIDARNLTLTANGPDAVTPDGELNLQTVPLIGQYAFVWGNSLPNLHNVTNGGSIRMPNVNPINFGSPSSHYGAFINHGLVADNGALIYADNFESDGTFSNATLGSFTLLSQTTTLTNGLLYAGGDVSITADSILTSNVFIRANRSLTLVATNQLTDTGSTNGSIWVVGSASQGVGFNLSTLPNNPTNRGDLLGTTITNFAPATKNVVNTWPGVDYGTTVIGYTNNESIGRLILDPLGVTNNTFFTFKGTGVSNAIYVDYIELRDFATNRDANGNFGALHINTNMVIYYAQAVMNGSSIAEKMNGKNNNRLRWVAAYAGNFSSTNMVYSGTTNGPFNIALAQDPFIDSDQDGTPNAFDSSPFFIPSQINLTVSTTNVPPLSSAISWNTIPFATNSVLYTTDLVTWNVLTNFVTNIPNPSPPVSVTVYDPIAGPTRYYQVIVNPWLTWPF